jgi:hypothetical protein
MGSVDFGTTASAEVDYMHAAIAVVQNLELPIIYDSPPKFRFSFL